MFTIFSIQKQQEMKKENFELQSRLNKLKLDYENALEQIKQKDSKIQQITKEVQTLVSFFFFYSQYCEEQIFFYVLKNESYQSGKVSIS